MRRRRRRAAARKGARIADHDRLDRRPATPAPVQRREAAGSGPLAAAPRVRALGETGVRLNAGAPRVAQRALAGTLSGRAPIQRKAIPRPANMTLSHGTRAIHFNEGSLDARYWEKTLPTVYDSRAALMAAIAGEAATIGNYVQSEVSWRNARGVLVEHWVFDASKAASDNFNYQPARASFKGVYTVPGAQPSAPRVRKTLEIDYNFGSKAAGYVVRVHDAADTGPKNLVFKAAHEISDHSKFFSHTHDQHDNSVPLAAHDKDPDAAAKVAGEGARWKAVAQNAGKVRDSSTLFTNTVPGAPFTSQMRGIYFADLYLTWKAAFGKRYGIPNSDIVAVLQEAAVPKTAGGEVKIASFPWSDLHMAGDICLDTPAATSDASLEPRAAMVLSHTAKIDFAKDYATQASAVTAQFSGLATAFGEVAYAKGGTFSFGAVTKVTPQAIAGNKALAAGTSYVFPAYRESVKATPAKQKIALQTGKSVFETECAAHYVTLIDAATAQLESSLLAPLVKPSISIKALGTLKTIASEKVKAKFAWNAGPLPGALLAEDQRKVAIAKVAEDFIAEQVPVLEQERAAAKPAEKPVEESERAPRSQSQPVRTPVAVKVEPVVVKTLSKSAKRRAAKKARSQAESAD